jgi:hypothetical protein
MHPLATVVAGAGFSEMAKNDTIKKVLIAAALIVAVYFGYKWVRKSLDRQKATEDNQIVTNSDPKKGAAKMIATTLRNAFNPSGVEWMDEMDGTNNKAVFQAAWQMKKYKIPYDYVAQEYFNTYSQSLLSRLNKELNATELKKFFSDAGVNPGSIKK